MLTTNGCLARCFIELYSDRAHWLDHFHSSTLRVGDATHEVEVARHLEDGGWGWGWGGRKRKRSMHVKKQSQLLTISYILGISPYTASHQTLPHPLPYTAPAHTHPTYILTLISSGSKCNAKAVCFLVARVHISGTNSHSLSNKSESCAVLYKPTVTTDCRSRRGVCLSVVMPVCLYVCL